LNLAIHNPTRLLYPKGSFQVGIVTTSRISGCLSTKKVSLPPSVQYHSEAIGVPPTPVSVAEWEFPEADRFALAGGRTLHLFGWWSEVLFPYGWAAVPCYLRLRDREELGHVHEVAVRLFTELGSKDFPFKIKVG
jgi:hypothetical protein